MCIRDRNETVEAESSRSNEINIFGQLALIMEMMNKNNDNLNTSLNEFKSNIEQIDTCLLYTSRCV